METYKRLYYIKNILTKNTIFYINVFQNNQCKIVIFHPFFYKKKEWKCHVKEVYENNDEIVLEDIDIFESSRMILTYIRDNHRISIEKIYEKYQNKCVRELFIFWDNIDDINDYVRRCPRVRKEEETWDSDFHIWPKFIRNPEKKYIIKDVIDALVRDDIYFIKKVIMDKNYLQFLFSDKYNPALYLGDLSKFESIPGDDFGTYDIYDNALIICCKNNSQLCLRYLLTNGAKTNYQNKMGQTPLHIAVQNNNPDIVRILLDHDANTNKFDKFGITPYKYA